MGVSLHAGVSCEGHQKEKVRADTARETALGHKREWLCRYIARPPVAVPRLSLSSTGKVVYTLKTPYRYETRACPAVSSMTWSQRLKRVFKLDIEICGRCGGFVRVIACIEDQDIIDRIVAHLRDKEPATHSLPLLMPPPRAPPGTSPLFAGKEPNFPQFDQQGRR